MHTDVAQTGTQEQQHSPSVTAVCTICRKRFNKREGMFFCATDDWLHFRVFICTECSRTAPMQLTLHEFCWHCIDDAPPHLNGRPAGTDIITWHDVLDEVIRKYDQLHQEVLDATPFTVEDGDTIKRVPFKGDQ